MANSFESRRGNIDESESIIYRVDFGPIPADPSDVSDNDIKALEAYHEHHPDQFPSSKFLDVRAWRDWRNPNIKYHQEKKWTVSYTGFFKGEEVTETFDTEKLAYAKLNELKEYNKKIALELIREARNFALELDVETPWVDAIDVDASTISPEAELPTTESEVNQGTSQQAPEAEVTEPTNPELDKLQSELSRPVKEAANKTTSSHEEAGALAKVGESRYDGEVDTEYTINRMEIDLLKEKANDAINKYQEFHNSFRKEYRTPAIQEQYRRLEKEAWDKLEELAHKLGGRIIELPRGLESNNVDDEDINPKTRDKLNSDLSYNFNQEGEITHIQINGNTIELNRPRSVDELLNGDRPARILYHSGNSILKDDDSKKHYKGYWIKGLNPHTVQGIETELSGNQFPISDIIDDTIIPSDIIDDPNSIMSYDSKEPPVDLSILNSTGDNLNLQSEGVYPLGEEGLESTPKVSLDDLRLAYARAEEAYNRKRGNEELEENFVNARDAYNTELERVLKLKVAEGQENNIHELFKNEVISLREQRITQSQELQGVWEKRFNNTKEKLLGWATKNKTRWMLANLGLLAAGGLLSLTGVGIPVAGALEVTRRSLGSVMSGVSARNSLVGLMEDGVIDRFGIKFKAVIPKLVQESLSTNAEDFKKVSDNVLKDRLGTLEAYYRLNGGKFLRDDQQQAYEKVLVELGRRVQENIIDAENNQDELRSDWQEQEPDELTDEEIKNKATQNWEQKSPISRAIPFSHDREINKQYDAYNKEYEEWVKSNPERYTSELLNTISDKRVQELDKFRRNRKIAAAVGVATTGILGGLLVNDMRRPGGMFNPNDTSDTGASAPKTEAGSGTGGATTGESVTPKPTPGTGGLGEPPLEPKAPPTGAGGDALRESAEATRVAPEQAAQQAAEKLAQDVSSLDSGETIWGEVAKQLGENATDTQIQQAVENLLQSEIGRNSIYELAQGTEGGRTLLAQWGIDNAGEMATLSKEQLYEISRYLARGELQGITELSLDNLTPFEAVEPPQVDVSEAIAPKPSTEAPTPSVEPTPSAAPVGTPAPEVQPIASTEFTRGLSEALGTNSLTESQLQNVIYSFATSENGSAELYNQIISNDEGVRFLSGFGVNSAADFANLRPDELYEIAQTVGVENLDKLPGFELNEIILSQFEDAPDSLNLVQGSKPLNIMDNYISKYAENLPGSRSLGKLVLEKYILETDEGRAWLYDAIENNQDKTSAGAENLQKVRELFRRASIKAPEDLKRLLIDSKGYPSAQVFWDRLSWVLKPGEMPGIKKALGLALPTKQ